MKRTLFLVLISLLAISSLIQAQGKKATGFSADSIRTDNQSTSNKVYSVVQQMALFPGGNNSLFKFISKNLRYPNTDAQGIVVCTFIVNADGSVSNPEILRSLEPGCDKEAIRIIKSLPKFIPAKQNGKIVRVHYTLPITFKHD